ncbi:hypothetical protein GW17_00040570 [Ensete ventricosum]|nr:hypothetical protein GW17_00040570 [Ensete ventricosum]
MPSSTHDAPTTQPGVVGEADQPSKKMKVLVSKPPSSATIVIPVMTAPRKETPALTIREKEAAPHGEGSRHIRLKLAGPHRGWCQCTSCSTEAPLPPTSEGGLHHSF